LGLCQHARALTPAGIKSSNVVQKSSNVVQKRVANLWTEFTADNGEALLTNGKEPQNPNKLVVAATLEMAKT
jgi:hypothetical protein